MVQTCSDREFNLQGVIRILTESRNASSTSNLVLQLALTELVKQVMREIAQDTEGDDLRGDLLRKAIQITAQLVGERAEVSNLSTTLSPYFERIYKSQRGVAKEMTALGRYLREARQGEVLRLPRVVTDAPVPFRVMELGVRGNPEGLIAQPLGACRLNLDRVQQEYQVRGIGYPKEVEIEGITFVIDTDGSIIVFLEGFPMSVIEQAGVALEQLVHALYVPLAV
ncbi:MAG: hypothetical protein ACAF41_27990 [Leptolyngbya sp. BL-A-14]